MESMIEKDILDSLEDLGYSGPIKDVNSLKLAIEKGVSFNDFSELIVWISTEIRQLCNFEEQIHPVGGPDDEAAFMMELSSFLREMNCPYPTLMDGPISQRLSIVSSRLDLINYLITELQAARMTVGLKKPLGVTNDIKAQIAESTTAAQLKSACIALGLPKPPETITSQQLFSKLIEKVKEQLSKIPKGHLCNPLFIGTLSNDQWLTLDQLNEQMKLDYLTRSELLVQRVDVTIQSFSWSDRVKKQEEQLLRVYKPLRQQLKTTSIVTVGDLLAARDDLTLIEKTASSNLRTGTATKLNKLLIKNAPPDRGGRPNEIEPPPPEMPPWQKRAPGGGAPQGQRQAGGRGSGRVQGGGWQGGDYGSRGGGGGGRGRPDHYGANHNVGYQDGYNKGGHQQAYSGSYGNQQYGGQQYGSDAGYYQKPYQQQGGYGGGNYQQQDQVYGGGGGGGYQQQYSGGGRGGGGRGRGRGGGRGPW